MRITGRQGKILNRIVQDYINLAEPISSEFLAEKHRFGICPATIRIEMQKLTDLGYIYQPHTSAGRVPTDKGYRFFVDDLLEKNLLDFDEKFFNEIYQIEKEFKDSLKFIQVLTKKLANFTSNLVVNYLGKEGIVLKEGWEGILKEPEFRNENYFSKFIEMTEDWEENIEEIEIFPEIKIYIGRENPLPKARDFSTIISPCSFPKNQEGILTIFGPKRMAYDRNIQLINSLTKILEEF